MLINLNKPTVVMRMVVVIKFIAVITLISGIVQMIFPDFVLKMVGGEISASTNHFFGIVGMFMALFGGLMWQTAENDSSNLQPIFWSMLQKFGASIAVSLGVMKGLFSLMALGVAGFDFASGIFLLVFWYKFKSK